MAEFPFAPYPHQIEIAREVERAVAERLNITVSSPTGCGKTAAVLVGLLRSGDARVVYATRTHSQITQVVDAVRDVSPTTPTVALGSRETACVNPDLQKSHGPDRNERCERIKRECAYFRGTRELVESARQRVVVDLEDLCAEGREHVGCPYFASQKLAESARLAIVPYNYAFMEHGPISIEDKVLVFDEAHNIDDFSREVLSIETPLAALRRIRVASAAVATAIDKDVGELLKADTTVRAKPGGARDSALLDHFLNVVRAYKTAPDSFLAIKRDDALSIWCLDASIAFATVARAARCVVLMSGTIPPTFDLGVTFPVSVETDHIVDLPTRLRSLMIPLYDGVELDSSYKNASNPRYLTAMRSAIAECCRHVPHGLVVFFSSYAAMNRIVEGLSERVCKPLFVESRDFDLETYRAAAKSERGALLCAVFRGRLSEGVNFADDEARGVVVAGLPYPNAHDPRVEAMRGRKGFAWYENQAFAAVNQAAGRCLRHRDDYGCVIFLESRMVSNVGKLSKWLGRETKIARDFSTLGPFFASLVPATTSAAAAAAASSSANGVDAKRTKNES
jgi:Rad3-related DNA helicase